MNFSFGYREVIPDQAATCKWDEIVLNTGGSQSTLQDFKVAERKGGYSYRDQTKYQTRNRFIYWRVYNDILELVEQSLDITLTGCRVRYKFADTPVLDGVSVCEIQNSVVILVATVSSVHRLTFPHPDLIHNREHAYARTGVEYTALSVFAEASNQDVRHPTSCHVLHDTYSNIALPYTSATGLSVDGEDSLFALAYASGTILLVRLNSLTGNTNVVELNAQGHALVPRFLTRALRGKTEEDTAPLSLMLHPLDGETLLFSLCRDGNVRVWSTERHKCAVVTDFPVNASQSALCHVIKKAVGVMDELYVGILHCFSSHSVIHIMEPSTTAAFKLNHLMSVHIPEGKSVVDFAITANLEVWTVLRSAAGETTLSVWVDQLWRNCVLEWDCDETTLDPDLDPKENYLNLIFHPGRFPVSVINKALSIYRKANIITDSSVPTQVLKERVCAVVDTEVYGAMRERELSAEEATELQVSAWQKFYSCVVEYYESGTRPLGLLVLSHFIPPPSENLSSVRNKSKIGETSMEEENDETESEWNVETSGVVLIKKEYISLVRPMDVIESVALNPLQSIDIDSGISSDMIGLVSVLTYLEDNLPDDSKILFEKCLKQLKSPVVAVGELYSRELSFSDDETLTRMDLIHNVAINLEKLKDIEEVVTTFLDTLDVGQPDIKDETVALEKSKWLLHLGHLYGSQLGMSFAAVSLNQIILLRFQLCRSLLLLEHLLISPSYEQYQTGKKRRKKFPQSLIERTSHLTQCYYLLLWISETPIYPLPNLDQLETSVSILKLNDPRNVLVVPHYNTGNRNITILHHFLECSASALVRLLLSRQEVESRLVSLWRHSFLPYVHVLNQLIWPICSNTVFSEFLLLSGQHLLVQEYTRLLSKWCHSNSFTRKFLLACSLMDTGEHHKAVEQFMMAAHGFRIDDFIRKKVVRAADSLVVYYVQVMKLFEQQGLHDLVVELAQTAITVAEPNEPELPTLHSVIFLHQLQLGKYKAAFEALLTNPDAERRKDCLQQLVVTLLEGRKMDVLMNFCFDKVRPELERILEARARSLDVLDNPYYNFAYVFHTTRRRMRRAGCIMYEQALRLSTETSPEELEHRYRCYLAAINSLCLVKPQDAWIVKPVLVAEDAMDTTDLEGKILKRQVEVLELADLKKEMAICRARLKLLRFSSDHAKNITASPNAHELVGVLTNAGLYRDALAICSLMGVPKDGVFSGLAGACVGLDENPNDAALDWLRENDATELGYGGCANLAWRLLERLLTAEEPEKESSLHRVVTTKLLHLSVFLPCWLVASYKKRNAAELLRLLLAAGRLEEAGELGIEYVEGTLGIGKERFGLDTSLLPQTPAVWMPLNTLDRLSSELKTHSTEDPCYLELHNKLKAVLNQYRKTVTSVSEDKLKMLQEEMLRA